jgi:hypothetical protein
VTVPHTGVTSCVGPNSVLVYTAFFGPVWVHRYGFRLSVESEGLVVKATRVSAALARTASNMSALSGEGLARLGLMELLIRAVG